MLKLLNSQPTNSSVAHAGILKLNAASTISAIVSDNERLAKRLGELVLQTFGHLLVKSGNKRRARWLGVLTSLVLAGKKPQKENAAVVLKLMSDNMCAPAPPLDHLAPVFALCAQDSLES